MGIADEQIPIDFPSLDQINPKKIGIDLGVIGINPVAIWENRKKGDIKPFLTGNQPISFDVGDKNSPIMIGLFPDGSNFKIELYQTGQTTSADQNLSLANSTGSGWELDQNGTLGILSTTPQSPLAIGITYNLSEKPCLQDFLFFTHEEPADNLNTIRINPLLFMRIIGQQLNNCIINYVLVYPNPVFPDDPRSNDQKYTPNYFVYRFSSVIGKNN